VSSVLPWNETTIVAGVDFTGCRAYIIGGNKFATKYAGSTVPTAGGGNHTQRVVRAGSGVANIPFGVRLTNADAVDLVSVRAAIQTAEQNAEAFRVQLVNAQYDLDLWAIVDYSQQSWLDHPDDGEIAGMVRDVKMNFIAQALYV
jgi:hypothetical protein